MGGFYGSIHVRTEDRDAVLEVAERVARSRNVAMLAGPAKNGWVGLYPELSGQDETVGVAIAGEVDGDVLHLMVHDDDIFAYWFYRDRKLVDSYHSRPGYFGEEHRAGEEGRVGQPEAFRPILGDGVRKLAPLLVRDPEAVFASVQLQKFAKALKIPNALTSYEYLQQGERTGIVGWRQFEPLPKVKPADPAEAERGRWMSEGVLLASRSREGYDLRTCRCGDGFLAAWQSPGSREFQVAVDWARPPQFRGKAAPIPDATPLFALVGDDTGRRVAIAFRDRVEVREPGAEDWTIVATVPTQEVVTGLAFSPDGRLLAHSSQTGETVTAVESGRLVAAAPRVNRTMRVSHDGQTLAFHPSGEWLAVAGLTLGLVSLSGEPKRRELCPGGRRRYEQQIVDSLAHVDLDELMRQQREQMAAQMEQFRRLANPEAQLKRFRGLGLSAQQLEAMKSSLESTAAQWPTTESAEVLLKQRFDEFRERQRAAREGAGLPQLQALANEPPEVVGFSRDGRWLWCGTGQGLRVYEWAQVVAIAATADEAVDMPPPRWSVDIPTTAVAEERDGAAILFGGHSRELHRLDLETGAMRELVRLPGPCSVTRLGFSADGRTLATATQINPLEAGIRSPSRLPSTFEVWDYGRLLALA